MTLFPRVAAVIAAWIFALPGALAQTSVVMRPAAALSDANPVTIGDVATITGADAPRLGAIELPGVKRTPGQTATITLGQVRTALDGAGVHWGRTSLTGAACSVRFIANTPSPATPAPVEPAPAPPTSPVTPESRSLLRTLIEDRLAEHYQVDRQDLKVTFRPEDRAVLGIDTSGYRVEIDPGGSALSARLPVTVMLWKGDRIDSQGVLTVDVLVRREVLTAVGGIDRKRPLRREDMRRETRWVAPGAAASPDPEEAHSLTSRTRLRDGDVITPEALESPIIIKRGAVTDIKYVAGGVTIALKATAQADARRGESIEFKRMDSNTTFKGTATARNAAIASAEINSPAPQPASQAASPTSRGAAPGRKGSR